MKALKNIAIRRVVDAGVQPAQNLLTWSEELNRNWSSIGLTMTTNQAQAPDGTTTAELATVSATSHSWRLQQTVTASTQYTFSFYAKRGTMTDAKYSVYNVTGAANIVAPTTYYAAINGTDMQRVSVTFTTPSGCTSVYLYIIRDSGVTGTMFAWGVQLNTGALRAYTKTEGTNVP